MANWKEYGLDELLSYEQPTPYIVESTDYSDSYDTPVLTAGKSFIIGYTNERNGIYNKLPVIIFDDFTTSTQYVNFPFKVKSSAMKILTANIDLVIPKFMFYRMQVIEFDHSTHKRYWIQEYSKIKVKIPSIQEQKRIVARIEELFSQLDSGVETLKTVKRQLEVYRQAVSKDVFNRIASESKHYSIKDVCKDIKVGIVIKPAQYYTDDNHGIRAFRSANVREYRINDTDWVYLTQEGHAINKRSELETGDVLIVRSGYPGTACVVTEEFSGSNAIDILIAKPDPDKILPEYLCAYTNSPYGRRLVSEKKRGVAQAHLNVGGYSRMNIIVPTKSIQQDAVNELSARLSVCDSIEKTVDTALQQAEAMRQSILKQAFEGRI